MTGSGRGGGSGIIRLEVSTAIESADINQVSLICSHNSIFSMIIQINLLFALDSLSHCSWTNLAKCSIRKVSIDSNHAMCSDNTPLMYSILRLHLSASHHMAFSTDVQTDSTTG